MVNRIPESPVFEHKVVRFLALITNMTPVFSRPLTRMPAAALLLPLLVVLPYAVLGAPTDPPLSGLIVRDYPSGLARRDIIQSFSDFVSNLADGVSKSDIIQGILPNFFQNIPSASKIKSQLGLNDTGVAALPLEVLNIPLVPVLVIK